MSRIAFDARVVNDRYHGIGRYAFHLVEALQRLDQENTYVIYLGRDQDRRFDSRLRLANGNAELRQGPWPLHYPWEQLVWPALLRRDRIDLFHSPYIVAPLFWDQNRPVIVTAHDMIFERIPEAMPVRWSMEIYRRMVRQSLRRAGKVICVSQSTANDLRALHGSDSPAVAVIHEGVATGFNPDIEPVRLEETCRQLQLATPFILNVGARRPHKNLHRLVEAFARISDEIPHQLVFAGRGDERFPDDAHEAVQKFGLHHRVRFLDWVPEEHLPSLYRLADVVVLPSLIEGFGLPALEAMACGTPVIASANSSFPEVVCSAGVLVDPTSLDAIAGALQIVLGDPNLSKRLRTEGLRRAKQFTWEQSARQVLDIYATLL